MNAGRELTVFDEYYQFRRQLVDALERDLLGPGSPGEVIADPPITKYIAGVLFPRDSDRTTLLRTWARMPLPQKLTRMTPSRGTRPSR